MAYRPIAEQRLCNERPLLRNARNIHARNNRRTVFSMWSTPRPFICNGSVNRLYNNRGDVFSAWSVPRSYLEDNWG
jgi:hypothetical protein